MDTTTTKRAYIGKCSKCKTVRRFNKGAVMPKHVWWNGAPQPDCGCSGVFICKAIKGFTTDHECSSKCMASKGPVCECSCGGKNHGINHA